MSVPSGRAGARKAAVGVRACGSWVTVVRVRCTFVNIDTCAISVGDEALATRAGSARRILRSAHHVGTNPIGTARVLEAGVELAGDTRAHPGCDAGA